MIEISWLWVGAGFVLGTAFMVWATNQLEQNKARAHAYKGLGEAAFRKGRELGAKLKEWGLVR